MTQQVIQWTADEWAEIEATRPLTIDEQWQKFSSENPLVYSEIRRRALRLLAEGYRRWGFELLWNEVRWRRQCRTTGKPFAMNNNYKKPCVEQLVRECPELAAMFVRKEQGGKADD